jgi:hypothetical protein
MAIGQRDTSTLVNRIAREYSRAIDAARVCSMPSLSARFRHPCTSYLVMRGVPIKAVQELGGWRTIQMVMRYADLSPELRRGIRRLKHAWLFVHPLPSLAAVTQLTEQYIHDHNELIPQSALAGATPAEVFHARWSEDDRKKLEDQGRTA